MSILIDAKAMECEMIEQLKNDIGLIKSYVFPKFVIINASNNEGNKRYIRNKVATAEKVGLDVEVVEYTEDVTNDDIISLLEHCNSHHIPVIVQLPIYEHLDENAILSHIDYTVDADGFNPYWVGMNILDNKSKVQPATPKGVISLLKYHHVELIGKIALVIGKSNHVGKPLSNMLMNEGATVIVAHSRTIDLKQLVKMSDIIISCVGKPELIHHDDIKEGAVLIGVGFTYIEGKQILDFNVDNILADNKALLVSNRINCTGKATVISLIDNVIQLYKYNYSIE